MKQRTIPALDTTVGSIGLGCMGMSWAYGSPDDRDVDTSVAVISRALDAGVTLLDTSDAYGAGHNEQVVGRALSRRRSDAIVATKVGLIGEQTPQGPRLTRNAHPEHIRAAVDASLARLGVDTIDLYYLHRVDPEVPLAESWGALAELVTAGKVRALGLSEVTTAQAAEAHAIHPVAAIQSEFSLWTRDPQGLGTTSDGAETGDVIGWTAAHDAIFVPFSPLGRGFLTGTLDRSALDSRDYRTTLPRFADDAAAANDRIVDLVRAVAARHDNTASAVALAWVLAQGEHIVPIPGTTKVRNLDANIAAVELELTPVDLAELDAAPVAVGTRY
ncbi:aldo/keto reductase [Rhodococcus sp. P1Y]|uniref:aldo/keto reductase n=1 Tax=Rhodococcus sp. P1Y TaxID=1302308 RepID=UPI000EAE524E|nr:aldo/keto reductase [Rhodococcus sp. P1Y]AYJ47333.1 aldo/keto reductase [Rhodococcus sp. P1Y]